MLNKLIDAFNGSFPLTISIYIVLLLGVVGVTTLLSRLCIVLKEKAHLSDGIIAGIVLGVITSLPELITCLTSVIVNKNGQMGVGDIIGSNSFDLFILSVCLIACVWIFMNRKVDSINLSSLICTGVGTVFVFLAALFGEGTELGIFPGKSPLVFHGFNIFSIPIFASYCIAIVFMVRNAKQPKTAQKQETNFEESEAKKSKFHKLPVWALGLLVGITAIVLIGISVLLTYDASSLINHHWHMDKGFGGSLLLGVCTSLPEIVACVNLCIHKEYNMTIDTMVGSTAFNLSILSISNVALACVYKGQKGQIMYEFNADSITQLVIGMIIIASSITYLVYNTSRYKSRMTKKKNLAINVSTLGLVIIAYITFIALGFAFYGKV